MANDLGQARRESSLTREQVLAQAIADKAFPSRRYRLETVLAGASRLLTEKEAARAQRRYGGNIVELVTMTDWLRAKAAGLPGCARPSCMAAPGAPCRNVHGLRHPHACRIGMFEPAKLALEEYLQCATCGAWPGKPCVSSSGRSRRVHPGRPVLAPPVGVP